MGMLRCSYPRGVVEGGWFGTSRCGSCSITCWTRCGVAVHRALVGQCQSARLFFCPYTKSLWHPMFGRDVY